jgi:hypothetical protein
MMWTITGILAILWLLCFIGYLGAWWSPLILGIATVVFLVNALMRDPESSWA